MDGALATCVTPPTNVAEGKVCDASDVRCAPGLSCLFDVNQPAVCFTPKKKGESCELAFECAYTDDNPLYCSSIDHVCVEPATSGPCPVVTDFFATGCAKTAYCDASHTCQPRAALGAACQSGQLCADRNETCDKSDGATVSDPGICVVTAGPTRCAP
jgi:hypothetical protein